MANKDSKGGKEDWEKSEPKPKTSRTTTGRILRCYEYNSDTHLRNQCPQLEVKKTTTQAATTGSKNTKSQQGNGKAM